MFASPYHHTQAKCCQEARASATVAPSSNQRLLLPRCDRRSHAPASVTRTNSRVVEECVVSRAGAEARVGKSSAPGRSLAKAISSECYQFLNRVSGVKQFAVTLGYYAETARRSPEAMPGVQLFSISSRKWTRPPASPAISLRSLMNAQHRAASSQVKVASGTAFSISHNFSVLSPEAEIARRPSALTATPRTQAEWPLSVRSSRPLSTSHTFSLSSSEAETARRPSALTATPRTGPKWPGRVRSSRPLSTSHTFNVWSEEAETASRPSPLTATSLT